MIRFTRQAIPFLLTFSCLLSAVPSTAVEKSPGTPEALQSCPDGGKSLIKTFTITPQASETGDISPALPVRGSWESIATMNFDGAWPDGWTLYHNYTAGGVPVTWAPETWMYCGSAPKGGWPQASTFDPNYRFVVRPPNSPDCVSQMIYGPFSLADASDAKVTFNLYYDLGDNDQIAWLASTNGSQFYGTGIKGGYGTCATHTFDLKSVPTLGNLCGNSNVWIMFLGTISPIGDEYVDGAFLDDIEISKLPGVVNPDLIVEQISVTPSSSSPGTVLTAKVNVTNDSVAAAGAFQVDFYDDRATAPGTGDAGNDPWTVSSLAAGSSIVLTRQFTPVSAGSYNAYAQVDRLNAVTEKDETNNVKGPCPYKVGNPGAVTYRAVICGISDYPGTVNDLLYCADDAIGIRSRLLEYWHWADPNIQLLVDAAATKAAVKAAIDSMRQAADHNDVCLFSFSGHGTTGPDLFPIDESDGLDEYIVPCEAGDLSSFIRDDELGEWLDAYPAPVTVILDTCFSGGQIKQLQFGTGVARSFSMGYPGPAAGDGFATDLQPTRRPGILTKDLDDTIGGVVLTACDDNEFSYEFDELQHGVFTYYLLEALGPQCGVADADGDCDISAEEMFGYARTETELYNSYQHPQMYDNYPPGAPSTEEMTIVIYCGEPPTADNMGSVRGDPTTGLNLRGIVTAKFADFMYVESEDRSSGVRVSGAPSLISVGDRVWFTGISMMMNGQKVILPTTAVFPLSGGNPLPYLGMRTRDVGGHSYGASDPGVDQAFGALNVGLLLKVHGILTYKDTATAPKYFYIWDGANHTTSPVNDGNTNGAWGIRINRAPTTAMTPWTSWIEVEGVVSVNQTAVVSATVPEIIPSVAPVILVASDFTTVNFPAGTILAGKNLIGVPHTPGNVGNGDSGGFDQGYDPVAVLSPEKVDPDWYTRAEPIDGKLLRWDSGTASSKGFDMWSEPHGEFGGVILGDGYWVTASSAWTTCSYKARVQNIPQWISPGGAVPVLIAHPQNHDTRLDPACYKEDPLTGVCLSDGGQVLSFAEACYPYGEGWINSTGVWWDNVAQVSRIVGVCDDTPYEDSLKPWRGYWFTWRENYKSMIVP